ncbi:hypothetical protein OG339_48775 (plasmid) [Streptosporangium sp. NBC_01495]|uniref:hypothetical protein n=1 Tax=Streptosporangium sp. NBC_01495 TaxID=2903899 RepID=UPI002E36D131|nr:hypothetical protein [Streptosporangium sp. NBC_01495]
MRVIESSWQVTAAERGHLTPEHQQKILEALDDGATLRSSSADDADGNESMNITLKEYTSPLGITRRAVVHIDPNGCETVDFDDDGDAEAHYEAQVRAAAECSTEPVWDASDVEGVPLAPYTWTLSTRVPGDGWEVMQTGEARLGDELDDRYPSTPTTLEDAAEAHLAQAAARYTAQNVEISLYEALGMRAQYAVCEAVRIEVSGDAGHGEFTITVQQDVPVHVPTPQEIADFRRLLEEVDQAMERDQEERYEYL